MTAVNVLGDFSIAADRLAIIDGEGTKSNDPLFLEPLIDHYKEGGTGIPGNAGRGRTLWCAGSWALRTLSTIILIISYELSIDKKNARNPCLLAVYNP